MDPLAIILIVLAIGCGGYAAFKADARIAGAGVVVLALLHLLGGRL